VQDEKEMCKITPQELFKLLPFAVFVCRLFVLLLVLLPAGVVAAARLSLTNWRGCCLAADIWWWLLLRCIGLMLQVAPDAPDIVAGIQRLAECLDKTHCFSDRAASFSSGSPMSTATNH
jgi:hypothetical protein